MRTISTKVLPIVGLVVCCGVSAAHASSLEDGLVAWWRMELKVGNTIPDASGNCHDLTVNGSPTFEDSIVIFNDDGTLEAADSDALDLMGNWSISLWAREDSNDHSPITNDSSGWILKIRNYHDSEGGWAFVSDLSRLRTGFFGGSPNCRYDAGPLSQGAWTRITTTYEAATGKVSIYLDDTLEFHSAIDSYGNSCDMIANVYPVILGGYLAIDLTRVPFCRGAMSDIRIYDRTLSDSEVADLFAMGNPECDVQEEILLRSGLCPTCQDTDPNVLVTSATAPNPQPALIWGGNVAPECNCGAEGQDPDLVAVTTHSTSDTWGNFTTTFELPEGVSEPAMSLKVRADDGAEIYLNETLVQTIDLAPVQAEPAVTHEIEIDDPGLFLEGTNTLRFYVVNTGNGHFGSPTPRGGPGDCMHVQFEARVTYTHASVPDCNENGVSDECDIAAGNSPDDNGNGVPDECEIPEDSDGDGVPDEEDDCPDSDLSGVIVIDGCDTGVVNQLFEGGCKMSDLTEQCTGAAVNNAVFVCCVAHLANDWKQDGVISGADKGAIQSCAAQADIP